MTVQSVRYNTDMMQRLRWLGIALVVLLAFHGRYLVNISRPMGIMHNDAFLVNFVLKHTMDSMIAGDWSGIATLPAAYGFSGSLFFTEHHLLYAVIGLPVYMISGDIFITSNAVVLLVLILSLFAMYTLLWAYTKNGAASAFGALVYVTNPYVMARFPDHLSLIAVQFLPLIFLYAEKSVTEGGSRNTFLLCVFLALQAVSSAYFAAFLSVLLPVYVMIRWIQIRFSVRRLGNAGLAAGAIVCLIVAVFLQRTYAGIFSVERSDHSLAATEYYSAIPTDYLFMPPQNVLYGGLKERLQWVFPDIVRMGTYSEQNLFPGVIVVILSAFGWYAARARGRSSPFAALAAVGVCAVLLSFGPYIHIAGPYRIPGPYMFLYLYDPFLAFIRTPARFGVLAFFALSAVSALGLARVTARTGAAVLIVCFVLMLAEYRHTAPDFFTPDPAAAALYHALAAHPDVRVIADLPMANSLSPEFRAARSVDYDLHYALYALVYHGKILMNGYGYLPDQYFARSNALAMNFPTEGKLRDLRQWGADAIVLHRDEYPDDYEYYRVKSALEDSGIRKLGETDTISIFLL